MGKVKPRDGTQTARQSAGNQQQGAPKRPQAGQPPQRAQTGQRPQRAQQQQGPQRAQQQQGPQRAQQQQQQQGPKSKPSEPISRENAFLDPPRNGGGGGPGFNAFA